MMVSHSCVVYLRVMREMGGVCRRRFAGAGLVVWSMSLVMTACHLGGVCRYEGESQLSMVLLGF